MAGSDPIVAGTRFVLKHQFSGFPKNEDFDFVEDPMPPLKDGQILMDALFMSVDPYMRPYVSRLTTPFTMIGMGVYKIRESRDTEYPQGGTVVANIGWVKTGNSISTSYLTLLPTLILCNQGGKLSINSKASCALRVHLFCFESEI